MRRAHSVVVDLPADYEAVRVARRLAGAECIRAGFDDLAEDAELVVSELVGNAVLHTGAATRLVLIAAEDSLRVEVHDSSSVAPVRVATSDGAMTGRGLRLVDAIARRWGVTPTADGKAVWAEISIAPVSPPVGAEVEELLSLWVDEVDVPRERHRVILGDIPTGLLLDAKAHVDNLVREFTLAAAGAQAGTTPTISAELADLIERVVTGFSTARDSIKRQAVDAAAQGLSHVRLELDLPAEAAEAGEAYLAAINEADRYCRASRLLTLEAPPQHKVFRHWYVGEIISQLRRASAGLPPATPTTFEQRLLDEVAVAVEARRASEHGARLQRLVGALAGAVTPEAVARAVLDEGVAAIGATGGGLLVAGERGTLAVPATVGYDEELVRRLRAEPADADLPAAYALRSGEPVWLESRADVDRRFPELRGLEESTVSMCAVPLEVSGRRLGALRFSFREARLFGDEERRFILTLAAYTAQALERAQLYFERVESSRRLQHSLLPPRLPAVPGVEVVAAYRPLGDGMEVGGDFYDAWQVGDAWAIAIGDVCGTGPEAAALNAIVRYTLRATTRFETQPGVVLRRLNETLLELEAGGGLGERFCTALLGILRTGPGGVDVRLAAGGHPGPLVRRGDGSVEEIEMSSSLLGIFDDPDVEEYPAVLAPGDVLLLYTDGASEARRDGVLLGSEGLLALLAAAGPSAGDVLDHTVRGIMDFVGGDLLDDLALLAVRPER